MGEATEPEAKPLRLYRMGPWPDRDTPAADEPPPLGERAIAWLSGAEVAVDAVLSRTLYREFMAQEQYRQRVIHWLGVARQQLEDAQARLKIEERQPNGAAEAWAYGFSVGARTAALEAAQLLNDAINGATDAVMSGARK
jgi:hypothetical protein